MGLVAHFKYVRFTTKVERHEPRDFRDASCLCLLRASFVVKLLNPRRYKKKPVITNRLHHLALGSRDPAVLAAFYGDVFNLEEVTRHLDDEGNLRSVWLDLGHGSLLMIERIPADTPRDESHMRPGLFLIAFTMDPEDRAHWEARLEEAGCAIEDRTPYTSYARDPEGNRIAVSHYGR